MERPKLTTEELLPDLPNYDPEPADGVRVGESPVPGLTLKRILRGHIDWIGRIAWSPDGKFLASPSFDNTIRIWDVATGECEVVLEQHESSVMSVTWSPDGQNLASGSADNTILIWHTSNWKQIKKLNKHKDGVLDVRWSPKKSKLASGSWDDTVQIWDTTIWKSIQTIQKKGSVFFVSWSKDGLQLASGGSDKTIELRNMNSREDVSISLGEDFKQTIWDSTWFDNNQVIASAVGDNTIRLWNVKTAQQMSIIEGNTDPVICVDISHNNKLLASKSNKGDVYIWRCDNWNQIIHLNQTGTFNPGGLAFHPHAPVLATRCQEDKLIAVWGIDMNLVLGMEPETNAVQYTTAKLVLVGDSGVGKTGLGWRMAHNEFKEHSSTHGQQFWPIPNLGKIRSDGTQCEAVLWDLAGQPIYRPIHSIFLDNVDASLILFDPTNRTDPLKGVESWLQQLKGKDQLPPSILIGARSDRGASTLSQQDLDQFCQQQGISGGYLSTSAMEGSGIDDLFDKLRELIPWDEMTTTVTTRTFKRVKDYVLSLKEKPDRPNVLVSPTELRTQLESLDENWAFTDAEMMTATGHLETHGYVTILTSSRGNQHILLVPELLSTTAASIHLLADKHHLELGAVSESDLLQGKHDFDELQGLSDDEQQILLDAAVLRFLEHNICFRERLDDNVLLIFPGLIKQKRPLQNDIPSTDDISYIVRGRVENIYASLVVLLGYTPSFKRRNQWQNQAQYQTDTGHICGFRLVEDARRRNRTHPLLRRRHDHR